MDSSVPVLLPRAPKELLAVGPLALYAPRPRHGKTGNPALDCGLRFLHAHNQPRESSLGDWFGWGADLSLLAMWPGAISESPSFHLENIGNESLSSQGCLKN